MIAFGPVPSRRLGQSLGINNILPKYCSYDCVYCQVGRTDHKSAERQVFYAPEEIARDVIQKVEEVRAAKGRIDFLTFVPDGEPTLDSQLGWAIELLRPLGIPIAVFTNGTLLWREDVRRDLRQADLVSVKVDAVEDAIWRRINRPVNNLPLQTVLDGISFFAETYDGRLMTETMLITGLNDRIGHLSALAEYLRSLDPEVAYLGIPTRPPAEEWVQGPSEERLAQAFAILSSRLTNVEYLIGYPAESIQATGAPRTDLLNITAVHPLRESEALELIHQGHADESLLDELLSEELLVRVKHGKEVFFVRKLL